MKFIALFVLCAAQLVAHTVVIAEPGADRNGWLYFRVTRVVQTEGDWVKNKLAVGAVVRPAQPKAAHPLGRQGEAVVFVFPKVDNPDVFWSYAVHHGCVPGDGGSLLDEFLQKLASVTP